MKKTFLLILALYAISLNSYAQKYYKTTLGIQGGNVVGIRVKHYIAEKYSLQAVVGWSKKDSYSIQTHIQWNRNTIFNNTNMYWGLGGFTGVYDNPSEYDIKKKSGFWLGVSGIAGIEYTFPKIPISCHLAATIGYSFLPDNDFVVGYAYGISYAFK